jgi:hypothetical protein
MRRPNGCLAALCATTGHSAVPANQRLHLRKINLVIFADNLFRHIFTKRQAAMLTVIGAMIFVRIRSLGQSPGMSLVPRLPTTGPRTFTIGLLISRWGLRRCPRCLPRALQAQQKLNQLWLRKPFEFLAIHG